MKTKPDIEDVLYELKSDFDRWITIEGRLETDTWYLPKPDNQIALNVYESITGKTTTNFIWLKLDSEILSSWINALEAISE